MWVEGEREEAGEARSIDRSSRAGTGLERKENRKDTVKVKLVHGGGGGGGGSWRMAPFTIDLALAVP